MDKTPVTQIDVERAGRQSSVADFRAELLTARGSPAACSARQHEPRRAPDHTTLVTTDHPVRFQTAGMETATTTGPLTVAQLALAITYGLAALSLRALLDWLTDRIADAGYGR